MYRAQFRIHTGIIGDISVQISRIYGEKNFTPGRKRQELGKPSPKGSLMH